MMPTVTLNTLVQELQLQYGIVTTARELRDILWYEIPGNDCYKEYFYGDGPIVSDGEPERVIENCVITILEDFFPDWESVLIDVSW
jgi:hypothetical protein